MCFRKKKRKNDLLKRGKTSVPAERNQEINQGPDGPPVSAPRQRVDEDGGGGGGGGGAVAAGALDLSAVPQAA